MVGFFFITTWGPSKLNMMSSTSYCIRSSYYCLDPVAKNECRLSESRCVISCIVYTYVCNNLKSRFNVVIILAFYVAALNILFYGLLPVEFTSCQNNIAGPTSRALYKQIKHKKNVQIFMITVIKTLSS